MKRVILHGVHHVELRRDVEYFLDDGYEIVGYSHSYYTSDILDGKRFIPPEQLPNMEFDHIILLSFRENILADIRSSLIGLGVPPEKIIWPTMFLCQAREKMQVDLIRDIETRYQGEEGLIFGLSYSLRGIFKKKLRPPFYDCSWHRLDLYYDYRIFQYMRRRGLLSTVKTALLVFPYYYFNFDMSRSMDQYRMGQIFAVRGLDDWHNYQKVPGASDYVANYRMFGRKISEFYHFPKYEYGSRKIYQGKDGEGDLSGAWLRDHPETVAENTALLADFCRELAETNITPVLVVPPYYVKGINQAGLKSVGKRKREFYHILETLDLGIDIFDLFDIYADRREFFADLTHLNADGAEAFTEHINQTVLRERMSLFDRR